MKMPKSFEEGLARLETLQQRIADPQTPLAETVKLYAEAAALIEYCRGALEKAKLQIEEIDTRLLLEHNRENDDEL